MHSVNVIRNTLTPEHGARLALLAIGLLLSYSYYTGIFCSDDTRYIAGIKKIASGDTITLGNLAERRLVFLLPGAISWWLTSNVDVVVATYGLAYVLLGQVAYACASLGMNAGRVRAGLLAGIGVLLCPLLLHYSGALIPDIACGLFLAIALLTCLRLITSSSNGRFTSISPLLIGVCLAVAVTIKESALVLAIVPPIAFYLVASHSRFAVSELLRMTAWFGGGMLATFAMEAVTFKVFSGVWHSTLVSASTPPSFESFLAHQGRVPLDRISYMLRMFDPVTIAIVMISFSIALARVLSWVKGPRTVERDYYLVLSIFFLWPLLYFTLGTSSLQGYMPPVMQERYYAPVLVPASILLGRSISELFADLPRWPRVGVLVFVIFTFAGCALWVSYPSRGMALASQIKESFQLAILEALEYNGMPVLSVNATNNADITRCQRLVWERPIAAFNSTKPLPYVMAESQNDLAFLSPPFLLIGTGDVLHGDTALPVITALRARLSREEWSVSLVRYYYADQHDVDIRWWQPRQEALLEVVRVHPSWVSSMTIPSWRRSSEEIFRHAELYLVTEREE